MIKLLIIISTFLLGETNKPIQFDKKDAVVWLPQQTISGEISSFSAKHLLVYHNNDTFSINVNDNRFSFDVTHKEMENKIWIVVPDGDQASDTLRHTLRYKPKPIIKPVASVKDENVVVLSAYTLENPYNAILQYQWLEDERNPASSTLNNKEDSIAKVEIPSIEGIYYYNLLVIADQDSAWFQTMIRREKNELWAYDIDNDDTPWMNDAVIYQITPHVFVENGQYQDITAKLPELKELGINTIWLQPVFKSHRKGSQGYDVVDYLSLNPDLGTESALRELIVTAKDMGMRVLFDVVLNHSSMFHPYAIDRKENGEASHYYDFYQYVDDGTPYSSFYDQDEYGFINYFWPHLPNLNYDNEEVQRWMLEACKYWIREFDIDGYRLDAIWGVNARKPSFAKRLRTELKGIKPEVLLLAEAKGSDPEVFELGYEAAYDWMPDTSWVSKWSWEYEYNEEKNMTVFNHPDVSKRTEILRNALFDIGGNYHRQLRFIENNDLPRFLVDHNLKQKKMAAALVFAVPGLPMLYNGQEIGKMGHPYKTKIIFNRDSSIQDLDHKNLFKYYKQLIGLYNEYSSLRDTTFQEILVAQKDQFVAFRRWNEDENIVVIINLDEKSAEANIDIEEITGQLNAKKYHFKDALNNDKKIKIKKDHSKVKIPMDGYSIRMLELHYN